MHDPVEVFHRLLHGHELAARRARRVQTGALHPLAVRSSDQPHVLQQALHNDVAKKKNAAYIITVYY